MRIFSNNKLAITTKRENTVPIIYVEIIHTAVGFDNFEYKRLINNEVRVFDSICQSGMRIYSKINS